MPTLSSEEEAIAKAAQAQALLAPFQRITREWGVETTHRFQNRIRELHLVAKGDLEDDWSVQVVAGSTGVVVAEFSFPEYGRLFDMRRVSYDRQPDVERVKDWVESKIDQGQIEYSDLAMKRKLSMTDPRVIHDLAWRIARSAPYSIKRRRWYNKGKEASLSELYDQLSAAMREVLVKSTKAVLEE